MSQTAKIMKELVALRKAHGLRQKDIAEKAGYTTGRINQMEHANCPTFEACAQYAQALNYRVDVFLTANEDTTPAVERKKTRLAELQEQTTKAEEKLFALSRQIAETEYYLKTARQFLQRGIA